jgi:hypothetical protein
MSLVQTLKDKLTGLLRGLSNTILGPFINPLLEPISNLLDVMAAVEEEVLPQDIFTAISDAEKNGVLNLGFLKRK